MKANTYPSPPIPPHGFPRLPLGRHSFFEHDFALDDAVDVGEDGAGLDDGHEFLGEADFALQAGPDLGVGEDW